MAKSGKGFMPLLGSEPLKYLEMFDRPVNYFTGAPGRRLVASVVVVLGVWVWWVRVFGSVLGAVVYPVFIVLDLN